MYIINKHLHILKLIKNNPTLKLKEMADLLDMSQQHLKLYLQDIYCELYNLPIDNISIDKIIHQIYSFQDSKNKLRKVQTFSKNDKIFYMIFRLLKDKIVKLSLISQELETTKRNLNYYLKEISESLKVYNLKIYVSNKGIQLMGSIYSKKKFTQNFIFKFFIEKEFFPEKIRTEVFYYFKIDNFNLLKKDIYKIIDILKCDCSTHNIYAFLSLYLAFKDDSKTSLIENISFNRFLRYKLNYYELSFFYDIFYFLKNSSFKNLNINYISNFFYLIDYLYFSKYNFNEKIFLDAKIIGSIFSKYIGNQIKYNQNFYNKINPWINYCQLKNNFSIDDMSFLNFNLSNLSNSNILNMTKEINSIIPYFTLFEGISLWYYFANSENENDNNIFVFKNLNSEILPALIKEIYKKHNIKITTSINLRFLKEYLLNNSVDNIITIENFKISDTNINIKNLFLPLPNYKKVPNL